MSSLTCHTVITLFICIFNYHFYLHHWVFRLCWAAKPIDPNKTAAEVGVCQIGIAQGCSFHTWDCGQQRKFRKSLSLSLILREKFQYFRRPEGKVIHVSVNTTDGLPGISKSMVKACEQFPANCKVSYCEFIQIGQRQSLVSTWCMCPAREMHSLVTCVNDYLMLVYVGETRQDKAKTMPREQLA